MLRIKLLIFFCTAMFCMAVPVSAQHFTFRTFSLSEGLPQSQVTCTLLDHQGYLWAGTNGGGLCRFDGNAFEVFGATSGLYSQVIRGLFEDEQGTLWVGIDKGLFARARNFHQTNTDNTILQNVTSICTYQDSLMLIGSANGLYTFSKKTHALQPLPGDQKENVLCLLSDHNTIWIGRPSGLWKINNTTHQPEFVAKMLGQGIYAIAQANAHSIWLASWNAGVIRYDVISNKIDTVLHDRSVVLPQCLYAPNENELWIGTQNNGLVSIHLLTGEMMMYAESEGLPHVNVRSITPDANGQLWIGTSGGGLSLCTTQNFRAYDKRDGIAASRVYDVLTNQEGTWIATGSKVQHLDDNGIQTFSFDSLTHGAKCKTLAMDQVGRLWIGTEGKGIVVLQHEKAILIDHRDGLPDLYIQKIEIDAQGKIWAGTFTKGLVTVDLDSAGHVQVLPFSLPFSKITSLFVDKRDRTWIGSNDGRLAMIQHEQVSWQSDSTTALQQVAIKSIAMDSLDRLWIGTEGKGIYVAHTLSTTAITFQSLTGPHTLSSPNIYLLVPDAEGNIWAGSEKGVDKISFEKNGSVSSITAYGPHEGFSGIETCHDAAALDQQGNLWFGTMNGLMRYTPGSSSFRRSPPVLHFESISLFYKPFLETKYSIGDDERFLPNTQLDYRDNHINFKFKAVDLTYPDEILYRWRLAGIEQEWSPSSKQESVNYTSLQPGKYTFQVQATTDQVNWSSALETSFEIKAPYWQTLAFRLATVAMGLLLISFLFYSWTRWIRKREHAKRQQLEIKNHILQLEQKALQLQMNPHFLFNALTSIKSLVAKSNLDEAQSEINAFAQLMRGILNNSRKSHVSLREEMEVLEKYLHIEQLCHQHKFEFSITAEQTLDLDEIEIPPMLIQPFVENAVIHGVAHLQHQGKIEIRFAKENDTLVCQIKDNGVGRERLARLREEKKPGHQSVAVEVTRERLEALKGKLDYTAFEINDVLNPAGEIAGTEIMVRVPLGLDW